MNMKQMKLHYAQFTSSASDLYAPLRNVLRIVASERVLVESAAVSAADEARVIVDAGHESTAIIGHWQSREINLKKKESIKVV